MSTGIIIGVIVAGVLLLVRKLVPARDNSVVISKEEMEDLTEEYEELLAVQGFVAIAVMIGIVLLSQWEPVTKWVYASNGNDILMVGAVCFALALALFGVLGIAFLRKGKKWAEDFRFWVANKYRVDYIRVLQFLALFLCILGLVFLSYCIYLIVTA